MAYTESLYDRGYLVDYGSGELVLYRSNISYRQSSFDVYHTVKDNENLLQIAREYYGSSSMWFFIADVNDSIEDIFDLPVGDVILIPNISIIQSNYERS